MMLEPMDTKKNTSVPFSLRGSNCAYWLASQQKKTRAFRSSKGGPLRVLARQPNDEGMSDDGMKRLGELVGGGS